MPLVVGGWVIREQRGRAREGAHAGSIARGRRAADVAARDGLETGARSHEHDVRARASLRKSSCMRP